MSDCFGIVVAAGAGTRLGFGEPKGLVRLGASFGSELVSLSVGRLLVCGVKRVVVTVPRGAIERFQSVGLDLTRVDLVEGGDTRAESVGKGLEFLRRSGVVVRPEEDLVAIHDAARPFFGTVEFHRLCERAADVGAAILAAPVVDAVCVVSERGVVKRYEPRDRLRAIQTPQVFRYELIMRAHTQNHSDTADAVDDGSLVLPFNQVEIVESSGENFKVTTPGDLERARGIFAALGERV